MSDSLTNLPAILDDVWRRLEEGAKESGRACRIGVLGTSGPNGSALRVVVLREAARESRRLIFHTDRRSPKVGEIAADPRVAWLFYDPDARVQVRAAAAATIHTGDALADAQWNAASPINRRTYLAPNPPSEVVAALDSNQPAFLREREPTLEEASAGRANFAAVVCTISAIDWLFLCSTGHRRARFEWRETTEGRLQPVADWLLP